MQVCEGGVLRRREHLLEGLICTPEEELPRERVLGAREFLGSSKRVLGHYGPLVVLD